MIEIFALAIAITIVTSLILFVNWIIEKRRSVKFNKFTNQLAITGLKASHAGYALAQKIKALGLLSNTRRDLKSIKKSLRKKG